MNIDIIGLIISFGLLIIAMTVHEFAHGWVAYKLGDPTAKYSGRLTLNPLAHIDPVGTVALPLLLYLSTNGRFVFGAAKPVPINFGALRNPKRDVIWVGASGPAANLILAYLSSLALKFLPLSEFGSTMLLQLVVVNLVLGFFNLIPIPPLDGSRIVMGLLPRTLAYRYSMIERYGFFIVIILIWLGAFEVLVWPAVNFFLRLFNVAY